MRALLALLATASLLLAGCGGSDPPKDGGTQREPTAAVWGTATDGELLPLAGVSVSFTTRDGTLFAQQTDQAGSYRFEDAPAGGFTIEASKVGYFGDMTPVTLLPGQEKRVDFMLEAVGSVLTPFNETQEFTGQFECGSDAPTGAGSCDQAIQDATGMGFFTSKNNHSFQVPSGWGGLLLEVDWSVGSGSDAVSGVRIQLGSQENGSLFLDAAGPGDPYQTHVNATQAHPSVDNATVIPLQGLPSWIRVAPYGHTPPECPLPDTTCPSAGGGVQFEYRLWVTVFFRSPVDSGFTAVPPPE